jgi:hypothetical protein
MVISEVFGDIATSIAQLNPQQVVNLKAPSNISERVSELVFKKKENKISVEESIELERFLALDLFISLTKARARKLLIENEVE